MCGWVTHMYAIEVGNHFRLLVMPQQVQNRSGGAAFSRKEKEFGRRRLRKRLWFALLEHPQTTYAWALSRCYGGT